MAMSARPQSPPMEPMEPIAEEKSELAMEIAQAVVEKLDIDRKLDEKMRELMLRGDRIFRDIQIRQEQSTEALCRTVGMCLESQRTFQEEHQRLLGAVKELATMVMPYTPLHSQALEAQARAAAIVEETEALKKHVEDQRNANACASAAIASLGFSHPATASTQHPALVTTTTPAPSTMQLGSGTFSITLRKADEVSLGLSVNADEAEHQGTALVVEAVLAGGAVESWNRQCIGDGTAERVVVPGDRIVKVNGIEHDVKKMLEECTKQRLVKLLIARNVRAPSASHSRQNSAVVTPQKAQSAASAQEALEFATPEKSALRKKAPEFVPSGAEPLQQTQHLAAPPGLFFPRPEDCSASKIASNITAKLEASTSSVSNAYDVAVGDANMNNNDDADSDKEN